MSPLALEPSMVTMLQIPGTGELDLGQVFRLDILTRQILTLDLLLQLPHSWEKSGE